MIEDGRYLLPRGWVWTALGEVAHPRGLRMQPWEMADAPFIGLEHLEAHTMKLLGTGRAAEMKSSAAYFGPGDVLYGRLRPYLNKVFRPDFEGLASAEFMVFPAQPHFDNGYLQYFLNSWDFVTFASRLNTGDRPRVDYGQLAGYPLPLPPLPEQQRIVAEIEKHFTRLDAAIASLQRARANLKRYRASVLKAACEGHLVPTEAELARRDDRDYEPASALLERILRERRARWEVQEKRRGKYRDPQLPDTPNLPPLPEGWVWARLPQLAELQGGITKGQRRRSGEVLRSVPYLRVANLQRGYLDLAEMKMIEATEAEIDQLRLVPGDVLFTEGGDRDKLGRGWVWGGEIHDCIHQNHVFRARLYSPEIQPKLVSWWGNSFGQRFFYRSGKQTTNLASINLTLLSRFPVPLPPADEQQRIVTEVERHTSVIQAAENIVEANMKRAERLRQAILRRAFEGKLVPQDPTDEPASVLLERIRAEREQAGKTTAKARRRVSPRRAQGVSA